MISTTFQDRSMKKINKTVLAAILTATALILSYIETVVSSGIIIPGIKLGLSNIPVVIALYTISFPHALAIGILKSLISLLIFGRLSSLMYSIFGIIFAILSMYLLKRIKPLSLLSVNVGGSFMHIIGQLIAASIMLKSLTPWTLFPLFGALSIVSGILTYIPERFLLKFIIKNYSKEVDKKC